MPSCCAANIARLASREARATTRQRAAAWVGPITLRTPISAVLRMPQRSSLIAASALAGSPARSVATP